MHHVFFHSLFSVIVLICWCNSHWRSGKEHTWTQGNGKSVNVLFIAPTIIIIGNPNFSPVFNLFLMEILIPTVNKINQTAIKIGELAKQEILIIKLILCKFKFYFKSGRFGTFAILNLNVKLKSTVKCQLKG